MTYPKKSDNNLRFKPVDFEVKVLTSQSSLHQFKQHFADKTKKQEQSVAVQSAADCLARPRDIKDDATYHCSDSILGLDLGEYSQHFDLVCVREDLEIFYFFFHEQSYIIFILKKITGSSESIFQPSTRSLLVNIVYNDQL